MGTWIDVLTLTFRRGRQEFFLGQQAPTLHTGDLRLFVAMLDDGVMKGIRLNGK